MTRTLESLLLELRKMPKEEIVATAKKEIANAKHDGERRFWQVFLAKYTEAR